MKEPFRFGSAGSAHLLPLADRLKKLPFWLLGVILLGILILWNIARRNDYRIIFRENRNLPAQQISQCAARALPVVS
jgi:hypothetical protein